MIRRRDLFLAVPAAGALAATGCSMPPSSSASADARAEKRKPRYQADSAEVRNYYRVNRYPAKS
jgi:hypothetical protein